MSKLDIAKRIAGQLRITIREAAPLLNGILELLKSSLQQGERVSIVASTVIAVVAVAEVKSPIANRVATRRAS